MSSEESGLKAGHPPAGKDRLFAFVARADL